MSCVASILALMRFRALLVARVGEASGSVQRCQIKNGYVTKAGQRRYTNRWYLRAPSRDGGKVRHETLATVGQLSRRAGDCRGGRYLAGQSVVAAGLGGGGPLAAPRRSAAVSAQARTLGLFALLGPACRERDLVMAMVISRVIRPESKLATLSAWADSTIRVDLDVAGASTDELTRDGLAGRSPR